MIFSIPLLIVIAYLSFRASPRERAEDAHIHGAGQIGLLAAAVFVGQIVGKWTEGGWVVLISFSILVLSANAILISPIGYRDPRRIHRIVREKARVQGGMASIVEWQSLKIQEYRLAISG